MKKSIIFAMALLTATTFVQAQQSDTTQISRNIRIERTYVPEVMQVKRQGITLDIEEPAVEPTDAKYSSYSVSLIPPPATLIPIQATALTMSDRKAAPKGFARIGFGPAFSWLADVWYPVINDKNGYFDIGLNHRGIATTGNKQLFNTNFGLNFRKNFDAGALYINAGYKNEAFSYYAADSLRNSSSYRFTNAFGRDVRADSLLLGNQSLNRADFTIGFRNLERSSGGWLYDANLNYNLLTTRNGIFEHQISGLGSVDVEFGDNHQITVDAGVQAYFYKTPYADSIVSWRPNVIIGLTPAYILTWESLNLRLGVKTFFNFGKGNGIAIAPDVKLSYTLSNITNLYVGLTGDYKVNSLNQTLSDNRYYDIEEPTSNNTYTPFDLFLGFNVRPVAGLLFEGNINYQMVRNQMFFYNKSFYDIGTNTPYLSNIFTADYRNGSVFYAKVRASYNYQERFNIFAQMRYNTWSLNGQQDDIAIGAWHNRGLEIAFGGDVKFGRGWAVSANYYYGAKTTSKVITPTAPLIVELPAIHDVNLGMSYAFSKQWSIFAQLNNILAIAPKLNYQYWNGYDSFGIHLLLGGTVAF